MKNITAYFRLIVVPQFLVFLYTTITSLMLWELLFEVLSFKKLSGEFVHSEWFFVIPLVLLDTYWIYRKKWHLFLPRFNQDIESQHIFYFGNLLVLTLVVFLTAQVYLTYTESRKELPFLTLEQVEKSDIPLNFKLNTYFIDKNNVGFDKLHYTFSKNGNTESERLQITLASPIYTDSSEQFSKQGATLWYVDNKHEKFHYDLEDIKVDTIENRITTYLLNEFEAKTTFDYLHFTPIGDLIWLKNQQGEVDARYTIAASKSPKYDSLRIKGIVVPQKHPYKEVKLAEMSRFKDLFIMVFPFIFILPILFVKIRFKY